MAEIRSIFKYIILVLVFTGCKLSGSSLSLGSAPSTDPAPPENDSSCVSGSAFSYEVLNVPNTGSLADWIPANPAPRIGMIFTASTNANIDKLKIQINQTSGASAALDIYFGSDPGEGVKMATAVLTNQAVPNIVYAGEGGTQLVEFTLPAPIAVTAGSLYRIELESVGADTAAYISPDPISDIRYTADGVSSALTTNTDFAFGFAVSGLCQ